MSFLTNSRAQMPGATPATCHESLGHQPPDYPLGVEITERIRELAARHCDREGGCHGPDHGDRVHRVSLYIGRSMGAKLDVLSIAAMLHDIGRASETKVRGKVCHATVGADMARALLKNFGFRDEFIEAVAHCIATHRYRGANVPETLEARILFDADKLDSIGAVGIGRAFLFAGEVGARLHNRTVEGTEAYSLEDTAYREFKVKMCKVKDRMLTPMGRQLALERHAFMELFFKRLDIEIYGRE